MNASEARARALAEVLLLAVAGLRVAPTAERRARVAHAIRRIYGETRCA